MKVKDLMIPVGEYSSVGKDATLNEVATALSEGAHRDVFVVNDNGDLEGVLTMTDIFVALEPNYKKLGQKDLASDVLTKRYVADLFKQYNLWGDTLGELCRKAVDTSAAEVMHVPGDEDYLNEEDDIEEAIHRLIVGQHQPFFVRSNGTISGILRLSDIFDEVKNRLATCVMDKA